MLLQYLQSIISEINCVYAELLKKRKHARKIKIAIKQQTVSNQEMSQTASITASKYITIVHQKNNILTIQIVR